MKIVGVGAGPKMITEEAIEVIKAADVVRFEESYRARESLY